MDIRVVAWRLPEDFVPPVPGPKGKASAFALTPAHDHAVVGEIMTEPGWQVASQSFTVDAYGPLIMLTFVNYDQDPAVLGLTDTLVVE